MIVSMILFSVAGYFYHSRLKAADRFARGQCEAYAAIVAHSRKAVRVPAPIPEVTPVTCTDETEEEVTDAVPTV